MGNNDDYQVQHYREMADDDYFERLAGNRRFKSQEDYEAYQEEIIENMTTCEECNAGLFDEDDYFDKCGEVGCSKFQCPAFKDGCKFDFFGKVTPCDLKNDCFIFKKRKFEAKKVEEVK